MFVIILLLVLAGAGITVAGLCGSGYCAGQFSGSDDVNSESTWPPTRRAFNSTVQLYEAVDEYLAAGENPENTSVAEAFGYPIGSWDVSRITDFSRLFDGGPYTGRN
jgi:hypothetical protein